MAPAEIKWRRTRFVGALLAIGVVWLGVLPWIGLQPAVDNHIKFQQHLGIDPSAMFYTELEIIPAIAHHGERLNESHEAELWGPFRSNKDKDRVNVPR